MDMDWVGPVAPAFEFPNLCGVAFNFKSHIVAVEELTVDDPLAILPVEFEAPSDSFRDPNRIQVESGISGWIHALIVYRIRYHSELEHFVALARGQNIVRWPSPITLFETVFDVNNASRRKR